MAQGRVVKRLRDNDGNPVGRANDNPILDTREYVVEFDDGMEAELAANSIAQNMYAQCDPDETNMCFSTHSLISAEVPLPFATQTRKSLGMTAAPTCAAPLGAGSCACSGKMARLHGKICLT